MPQSKYKILVISIADPILIGVYKDNILLETISKKGKTSDVLPSLVENILIKYTINEIFYVSGPGSYMAIKIAYIFLKTISIVNDIKLYAVSGFDFNNNSPIKALGKKYFFREFDKNNNDTIVTKILGEHLIEDFKIPQKFIDIKFTSDTLPEYNLPAV